MLISTVFSKNAPFVPPQLPTAPNLTPTSTKPSLLALGEGNFIITTTTKAKTRNIFLDIVSRDKVFRCRNDS